ncbi:unnamed protein product [Linum tenue]|uniref:Pentatricopeptide repeat-containing protein n=1 Tax=Linum tenue TaxID=586396 RepID=A0AAV0PPN5_9ROSI|nr:unnamed protein product [Linum tenue]
MTPLLHHLSPIHSPTSQPYFSSLPLFPVLAVIPFLTTRSSSVHPASSFARVSLCRRARPALAFARLCLPPPSSSMPPAKPPLICPHTRLAAARRCRAETERQATAIQQKKKASGRPSHSPRRCRSSPFTLTSPVVLQNWDLQEKASGEREIDLKTEREVFDVLPVTENNTAVVEKSFVSCKEVSDQESCKLFPFVAMAVKTLNLGAVREGKFVQAVRFHGYAHSIRAFKMVIELRNSCPWPNVHTYTILLNFYRISDLEVDLVHALMEVLDEMQKFGLTPTAVTHSTVVHAPCKVGYVECALEYVRDLRNSNCSYSSYCYNAIIRGFCQQGEVDEALKLLEEMRSTRISSDIYSYSILIHGFCQKGDFEKCDDLWKEMAYWNIHPNIVMHSSRVSGVAVDMYFFRNSILLCEGIGRSASLS